MPLMNHFRPPVSLSHPWQGFHSAWATTIARLLNEDVLPARYYAIPNVQLGGGVEIDVATLQGRGPADGGAQAEPEPWSPPEPAVALAVDFTHLDVVEVQVLHDEGGPRLTAAVELVSPANKDRPAHRRAFGVKCASYLQQGSSVVVIDIVTDRRADLHAELLQVLQLPDGEVWTSPTDLYAVAYRTVTEDGQARLQVWPEGLAVGSPLPRLPLWLGEDLSVPLDLEASYQATCRSLRLRPS